MHPINIGVKSYLISGSGINHNVTVNYKLFVNIVCDSFYVGSSRALQSGVTLK